MAKATQYQQDFAAKMQKEEEEGHIENLPTLRTISDDSDAFESVGSMLDELREGGEYSELSVFGRPKQQPGVPAQRGNAFLMVCGANDYTLAELMSVIQESWGEGLYTIKGKRGGKYAGQKTIPIGPAAVKPGVVVTASPQPATVDTTKQLAELFEKISRQQTETMASMLGSVLTKLDRPTVDPMSLQRDTIAMIASMRDMFSPPQQTVSPTSSFSQLKELLEMKDLLAGRNDGEGSGENSLMDMAKTFLPALIASAQAQPQTQAQIKQPALPRPNPTDKKQTIKESPAMLKMLQGIKTLIDAAKRDSDLQNVELYAELIIDQFDIEQIKSFVTNDNALDKLAIFSKDVTLYRPWFEKLRATILQWVVEAESEEHKLDNATGDHQETTDGDANSVTINGNPAGH